MKIKDLVVNNEFQYLAGIVIDLKENISQNGQVYLSLKIRDDIDEIDVKVWKTALKDIKHLNINNGSFVVARGRCQLYKEKKQFSIDNGGKLYLRLVNDEDGLNIDDYVKSSPVSYDSIKNDLLKAIELIKDRDLNAFIFSIYDKYMEKIISSPASIGVHHDYKNGLGYHLLRMVKSAIALSEVYKNNVNFDLLISGVLVHDIGKINCYNTNESGLPESYTDQNNLLGHIPLGLLIIEEFDLREDKKDLIRHMILSHHGRMEYGAVVPPMFIEAELLHFIDTTDARITIMENELDKLEVGTTSERIWSLDRAKLIKLGDL